MATTRHGIGALFGFVLGFGASLTLNDVSGPSVAAAPLTAGVVMEITFSKAHALETSRSRRRAKREAAERAEREAEEKRREEAKTKRQAGRRADLPADCVYDSYASAATATEVYSCDEVLYRQYEEKGITGYEAIKP